jgi:glucan phosphoethanolaminetransferase (alkaline phosphatase superfamily)
MSIKRATRFLQRVLVIFFILLITALALVAVQELFHPFTAYVQTAITWLDRTEELLSQNSWLGISLGMIVLTVLVAVFPLLLPRVNKKQYRTNTVRGVIASVVFFFTQLIYTWAETFGRLHLLAAMLMAIIITVITIEFLALLMRQDEEVNFRTDLLAAAASGLASGIVIKLIEVVVK